MKKSRNEQSEEVKFKSASTKTHTAHYNHDTPFCQFSVKKQFKNYDPDEMYAFEYRPADEHADFVTNAREEVQFHILQLSQKCQLTIYLADILVQH